MPRTPATCHTDHVKKGAPVDADADYSPEYGLGACATAVSRDTGQTIVWLAGVYDASTRSAVVERLAEATSTDDPHLIVDLSEVEFIGASTFGLLVRVRNALQRQSRGLSLRSPSPRTKRLLEVCGLADLEESTPVADRPDQSADGQSR